MNTRDNALAILEGRQPDYYFDLISTLELVDDPVGVLDAVPQDGFLHKDSWGTSLVWHHDAPGEQPVITDENVVIKNIEQWDGSLQAVDPRELDCELAGQLASHIARDEKLVCCCSFMGLFERSHFLLGMENALVAYMENPEKMAALLRLMADNKLRYIECVAKHIQPDILWCHDDWGTKRSLFLPPEVRRDLIKPLQREIMNAAHDHGMLYMHHADCVCQPIVKDMVDIDIDIWQGVIPQNDIVGIQRTTAGKMAMIGGIDSGKIDVADAA